MGFRRKTEVMSCTEDGGVKTIFTQVDAKFGNLSVEVDYIYVMSKSTLPWVQLSLY